MAKQTKENILEAAKVLFSKSGFDGCNVDLIAAKAKVNKATIYYHFKNKANLYETVLEVNLRQFLQRVKKNVQKQDSPEDKLKAFTQAYVSNFTNNKQMAPLMLRELASDGAHLTEKTRGLLRGIIGEVDAILKEGCNTGVFKPTETFLPYFMIVGSMNIYTSTTTMRKKFRNESDSFGFSLTVDETAEELTNMILNGLRKKGA
jgi:AcrR family transcriptional regulator